MMHAFMLAVGTATTPWTLFMDSFDAFTVLLILGSVVGVAVVFQCLFEIRASRIVPQASLSRAKGLAEAGRWKELRTFAQSDSSFVGRVLQRSLGSGTPDDVHEAAEIASSDEASRWFRKIEMLNVIGNLGPLVGLAGTVWGMILAFTSLGETGGQAGPADLSLGISKALFHTLLGLCLAIPCLLAFGIYRGVVDRLCTRGMGAVAEIVAKYPGAADASESATSRVTERA